MSANLNSSGFLSWSFYSILIIIGILNIVLIHPVPGIIYLSFICLIQICFFIENLDFQYNQ